MRLGVRVAAVHRHGGWVNNDGVYPACQPVPTAFRPLRLAAGRAARVAGLAALAPCAGRDALAWSALPFLCLAPGAPPLRRRSFHHCTLPPGVPPASPAFPPLLLATVARRRRRRARRPRRRPCHPCVAAPSPGTSPPAAPLSLLPPRPHCGTTSPCRCPPRGSAPLLKQCREASNCARAR